MDFLEQIISNSQVGSDTLLDDFGMLNFLQDIEGIHINSLKEFSKYLNDNNLGVFLTYRQIDIIKRPKVFDKIKLTTFPFNTKSISGYRHIYILDEDDQPLVKTTAFGVFVDLDSNNVCRIPKDITKTISDKNQDPTIEILPRKIELSNNNEMLLDKLTVKKSFIDRYRHMNNSYYIKVATDAYNEDLVYNRIRAEYIKPFKLNDEIYIYLNDKNDEKTVITLRSKENELYFILELTNMIQKP